MSIFAEAWGFLASETHELVLSLGPDAALCPQLPGREGVGKHTKCHSDL